jgi:SAM-dependent methyltransferase
VPDQATLRYYEEHAAQVFERYMSADVGIAKYFQVAFLPKSRLLDIGAGAGRNLASLVAEEHEAYGVEPSEQLRNHAIAHYPTLEGRLLAGRLPGLPDDFNHRFDGVICSAVFMHIPESEQFDAAVEIREVLKPDGRLLIAVPSRRDDIGSDNRDKNGRLFAPIQPNALVLLFERLGFQLIGRWEDEDSMGRAGVSWTTMLFRLSSTLVTRPIDQVEGLLTADRKVATYKLALLRALTEVALTQYHRTSWRADGSVAVPIDDVAQLWIGYYWPIVENESSFIPQIRGERRDGGPRIAFRALLEDLTGHYRGAGGLARFTLDLRQGFVRPDVRQVHKRLLQIVRRTIVDGPVTHAGATQAWGRLFGYDQGSRSIIVGAEIWQEFCLSGHWILDALILRWAELTSEISGEELRAGDIIDRLLVVPLPERDVSDARRVFQSVEPRVCVWTDRPLSIRFDIDHLLPFSLWRSNDLWNLLPASPAVNREKRDLLPTKDLLRKRQDVIIHYWTKLRQDMRARFDYESKRFGVTPADSGLGPVFARVVEAVEYTRIQRGCGSWEP